MVSSVGVVVMVSVVGVCNEVRGETASLRRLCEVLRELRPPLVLEYLKEPERPRSPASGAFTTVMLSFALTYLPEVAGSVRGSSSTAVSRERFCSNIFLTPILAALLDSPEVLRVFLSWSLEASEWKRSRAKGDLRPRPARLQLLGAGLGVDSPPLKSSPS